MLTPFRLCFVTFILQLQELSRGVPGVSGRHAMLGAAAHIFSQPLDTPHECTSTSQLVIALQRLQNSEDAEEEEVVASPVVQTVSLEGDDTSTDDSAAHRQEGAISYPRLLELLTKAVADFDSATSTAAAAASVPDTLQLCKDVRAQLRELGFEIGPVRLAAAATAVGCDTKLHEAPAGAEGVQIESAQ